MSSNQESSWRIGIGIRRYAPAVAPFSAAVPYVFVAGAAWAAPAAVEVLKQMPPKGSVRQGDVVYVDDGRCPRVRSRESLEGTRRQGLLGRSNA